ncbi:ribosome maturation factor RimP [Nonomuraea africana]|uniref:Ribosome maturation factor RimP n=1 Tax=Nonomuraea africana TaxID=46171 RepID=A0ABR9KKJ5_9ACTN|nr:ribosome maturation factor RimP [Nonomuraea africana]MBE1562539.1 ribosome maturation factor RimP [Nonomuraea africana]
MGSESSRDHLMKLLEPVVATAGLDLEDVTVTRAGKRSLLRVVVDKDGGVTLDDIAEVSQGVSDALDADDSMGQSPYTLEVSSPGVDRPLTEPRHWRRAAKRLVKAELRDGGLVEGRIRGADESSVEIDVDGALRRIDYQDLTRGRVQVEFRRFEDEEDDLDDTGDEG